MLLLQMQLQYHQKLQQLQKVISDFSLHAKRLNKRLVAAIKSPAKNIAFKIVPDLITKSPPNRVNITVVIQPKVLE